MFVALPIPLQVLLLSYLGNKPHNEADQYIQMLKSLPPATVTQAQPAPAQPPVGETNSAAPASTGM